MIRSRRKEARVTQGYGMGEQWGTLREFFPDPEVRHSVSYIWAHRFLPWYVHEDPTAFFEHLGPGSDVTRFLHSRWFTYVDLKLREMLPPEEIKKLGLSPVTLGKGGMPRMRCLSDLSGHLVEISEPAALFIQMPVPERAPEAFFAAVVPAEVKTSRNGDKRVVSARYFTLEMTMDGGGETGVVCEWTESDHSNFARHIAATREAFLSSVRELMDIPAQRLAVAGFNPAEMKVTIGIAEGQAKKPWWKFW